MADTDRPRRPQRPQIVLEVIARVRLTPHLVRIVAGGPGISAVTDNGFAELTEIVKSIADEHSHGRLISVLEGGYHLTSMPASIATHLKVLMY